VYLAQTY